MLKALCKIFFIYSMVLFLAGCIGPAPHEDYTLSHAAIHFARQSGAEKLAPGYWHKAEKAYQMAEIQYKNKDFEEAKVNFLKAKKFAERAENISRLKQFQTGEGVP